MNVAGIIISATALVHPAAEVAIFAVIIGKAILSAMEAAIVIIPPKEATFRISSLLLENARIVYGVAAAFRSVAKTEYVNI